MKVISSPRRTGKTMSIIEMANETGAIIVVPSQREAARVFRIAKSMGATNVNFPLTWSEFKDGKFNGKAYDTFLIDQLDGCIQEMANGKISAVTVTEEPEEANLNPTPVALGEHIAMLVKDNQFVAYMGSDRACVEVQLSNPKNARLLKQFIQFAMISDPVSAREYLDSQIEDNKPEWRAIFERMVPSEKVGKHRLRVGQSTPGRIRVSVESHYLFKTSSNGLAFPYMRIHRTEANHGITCSTCDGGGCPDCTDLAT